MRWLELNKMKKSKFVRKSLSFLKTKKKCMFKSVNCGNN